MQMLSKKSKYALRALLVLAGTSHAKPVQIAELAAQERIPKKFLEAILLELKNKGLLHSKKGKGGGYRLAKRPEAISLGDVIRALDGPLAPLPCVSRTAYRRCEECDDEATCGIRAVMSEVRDATALILDHASLAAVLRRMELLALERHNVPMYTI